MQKQSRDELEEIAKRDVLKSTKICQKKVYSLLF